MELSCMISHAAGVDVVLNGHDHNYQRFCPQDAGRADPEDGLGRFVVGTGGGSLYGIPHPIANTRGLQRRHLRGCSNSPCTPRRYEWELSPWRVRASLTQVLPSAAERQVEQQGKGLLPQGRTAEVSEFPKISLPRT